jgi:mannose-6-phosphate isomerase-like protein (cupin superfamily)
MNIAVNSSRAPRIVEWAGTVYKIHVDRYQSGGIIGVFEGTVPSLGGPPVHVHHNEDEVIYILEGQYEFWLDGQISLLDAGASIFLPRGVPHTFRVRSSTPARNLAFLTPGGLEEFFVEAGGRGLGIPQHLAEIKELAAAYGVDFLGPAKWPE